MNLLGTAHSCKAAKSATGLLEILTLQPGCSVRSRDASFPACSSAALGFKRQSNGNEVAHFRQSSQEGPIAWEEHGWLRMYPTGGPRVNGTVPASNDPGSAPAGCGPRVVAPQGQ